MLGLNAPYFKTRDLAVITIFAASWGILNGVLSPIFFRIFNLPFLCDVIGFPLLILVKWYVKKFGAATLVGFIATTINFMLIPAAIHFLGFTVASIAFDVLASFIGHKRLFKKRALSSFSLLTISTFCAFIAGSIIGVFFLPSIILLRWGGVVGWAGLHAAGGYIGGILGVFLINALTSRGIQ
jgi:hypothetical protein